MTLGERIRKLRKAYDLTQREFGERINLKSNSIALIEGGRNTSDQTISAICREFNVNEDWLRTGEGEMFFPKTSNTLDALAEEWHLTGSEKILIEKFLNLKPETRQGIINYIVDVADALQANNTSKLDAKEGLSHPDGTIDIDAEVAAYRQELEIQKKARESSSVSDGSNSGTARMV